MKFLLIIPTDNNYDTILKVVDEVKQISEIDFLVIDYGSNDNTKYLLTNNNIPHMAFPIKTTYNKAIQLGVDFGLEKKYDALIEWDANDQFKTEELLYALRVWKNSNVDLLLGNRFTDGKKNIFSNKILSFFIRLVTSFKIKDPTLNFKIISKNIMESIAANKYLYSGPDTISGILKAGFKVKEIEFNTSRKPKKKSFNYVFKKILLIIMLNPLRRKEVNND